MRSVGLVVVTALLVALAPALTPFGAPLAAAATCRNPEDSGGIVAATPWPQQALAPERVWPFTTGGGVTVAVVGAGTDRRHPQLRGAVRSGYDLVEDQPAGDSACVARDTATASIIAGRGVPGIGFRGFAPGAVILPVRIADRELNDDQEDRPSLSPDTLAEGIRWAADHDADVITMSVTLYADSAALAAAIRHAHAKDAVVVAPVGDNHRRTEPVDPTPFPAAHDGVIGVGASQMDGQRHPSSQVGDYVDLVAPGDSVTGATLVNGYGAYTGTGFAAAFVSATAALVRSAHPELTADQVRHRLLATASPTAGVGRGTAYGAGVIDPYRAVTETVTTLEPAEVAPVTKPVPDPDQVQLAQRRAEVTDRAVLVLGAGALLFVLGLVGALTWVRGRRRRWRPGLAAAPETRSADDDIDGGYSAPLNTQDVFAPPPTIYRR